MQNAYHMVTMATPHSCQRQNLGDYLDTTTRRGTQFVPWDHIGGGEKFPAFSAHAQPTILRIWKEAHSVQFDESEQHCGGHQEGLCAWWRHQMQASLLAFCAGTSPLTGQWRGALMFSLIYAWKTVGLTIETPVVCDDIMLIMTSL